MPPRRKILLAIAIGVALSVPSVVALNLWLSDLAARRGREELELAAQRSMALAEGRIARALATLDDLVARGIDSCSASHIDTMRQATFATTPVKELSIVAADGRTLCSDLGWPPEQRAVVSSERVASGSDVLLEVVHLGGRRERAVRLHKPGNGTANGLAALVPSDLLLAAVSAEGALLTTYSRMTTRGGSLIGDAGEPPEILKDGALVRGPIRSERYALDLNISPGRAGAAQAHGDLRAVGVVVSGLLAFLILAFSLLTPKRERDNPVAELERALKAGEFVPYYQPIVDIRSGRLRGAEVLIRWRKQDGSIDLPVSFIPLAESSGLIVELTRTLMQRVCQEFGPEFGRRPHLKISFNLTARHFANEDIVEDVRRIFNRSQIRLSQVVLEVTERQPLENLTETRRIVAALQGLGVRIAIDDVGTGHSGLSYMLKLGADIIKIDKMFIDALGTDRNSNAIIETLIDLARNMRMDIIAEGVESFEQVVHLRELGVGAAQGFVFAPPLTASGFLQLVEALDPLKAADGAAANAKAA